MSALVVAHPGRAVAYGAEELKRAAHRHGFTALSISIIFHFSAIGCYYLSTMIGSDKPAALGPLRGPEVFVDPNLPIPGVYELPPAIDEVKPGVEEDGIPTPVDDNLVPIDRTISSQRDRVDRVDPHGVTVPPVEIPKPEVAAEDAPPDTFRVFERDPMLVKSVMPEYPSMALQAGLEGKVFVKIWVDRDGKVRQVKVLKSDYDIFNEAALEAAKQFVFTPAYMNSGPVSVWVAFPFTFKIASK
jgi:protein TonB